PTPSPPTSSSGASVTSPRNARPTLDDQAIDDELPATVRHGQCHHPPPTYLLLPPIGSYSEVVPLIGTIGMTIHNGPLPKIAITSAAFGGHARTRPALSAAGCGARMRRGMVLCGGGWPSRARRMKFGDLLLEMFGNSDPVRQQRAPP